MAVLVSTDSIQHTFDNETGRDTRSDRQPCQARSGPAPPGLARASGPVGLSRRFDRRSITSLISLGDDDVALLVVSSDGA